jgi:hypothetical protein
VIEASIFAKTSPCVDRSNELTASCLQRQLKTKGVSRECQDIYLLLVNDHEQHNLAKFADALVRKFQRKDYALHAHSPAQLTPL